MRTFYETTVNLTERIRFLTDVKFLAKEILNEGHIVVTAENGRLFVQNVKAITFHLNKGSTPNNSLISGCFSVKINA